MPLIVQSDGTLVDGFRRVIAMKKLGILEADVIICNEKLSEDEIAEIQFVMQFYGNRSLLSIFPLPFRLASGKTLISRFQPLRKTWVSIRAKDRGWSVWRTRLKQFRKRQKSASWVQACGASWLASLRLFKSISCK